MVVKVTLILALFSAVTYSMFVNPKQPLCPVSINTKAIMEQDKGSGLESCFKHTPKGNKTREAKTMIMNPAGGVDCTHKCILERQGVFDKEGKFVPSAIKEHYKKFSNATETYIEALDKIYNTCKDDTDKAIAEMNKNGTVVEKCTFHGRFTRCTSWKVRNIKTC